MHGAWHLPSCRIRSFQDRRALSLVLTCIAEMSADTNGKAATSGSVGLRNLCVLPSAQVMSRATSRGASSTVSYATPHLQGGRYSAASHGRKAERYLLSFSQRSFRRVFPSTLVGKYMCAHAHSCVRDARQLLGAPNSRSAADDADVPGITSERNH